MISDSRHDWEAPETQSTLHAPSAYTPLQESSGLKRVPSTISPAALPRTSCWCPSTLATTTILTYMHLRIKFFCRRGGVQGPADIVLAEVVGAVSCVPGIRAAGPGQLRREGGDEVVKSPSHDGVVVGGYVKIYDTDGKANSWRGRKLLHSVSVSFRQKKKKEKRSWLSHQLPLVTV